MFFSPLEQFRILPLCTCSFLARHSDFTSSFYFTNSSLILAFIFSFVYFSWLALLGLSKEKTSLLTIPSNWQGAFESLYILVRSVVSDNIKHKDAGKFFPLVNTIFFFVLFINLFGLIPYSYTLTSQLIVTLTLSFSIFIGINIISVKIHGLKFFSLFLPSGTSVGLAFLLVPIELISYVFKPVSLGVRLFANMMAGHTLLKVIAGFASTLLAGGGFLVLLSYVPLLILIPLFGLELGVALIQTYVFTVLICIYIQDSISISH